MEKEKSISEKIAEKGMESLEKAVAAMNGAKEKKRRGRPCKKVEPTVDALPKIDETKEEHRNRMMRRQRKNAIAELPSTRTAAGMQVNFNDNETEILAETLEKGWVESQDAKADAGKPRLSLVPMQIMFDIAEIRAYGNEKYGSPDNWKNVEMRRYVDALLRHTMAFVDDPESRDAESGLEHYKHMACNMAFICHMMAGKK